MTNTDPTHETAVANESGGLPARRRSGPERRRAAPYVKVDLVGSIYEAFSSSYPHVFAQWRPGTGVVDWYNDVFEAEPFTTTSFGGTSTGSLPISLEAFQSYVRRKGLWDTMWELGEGRGRAGL